MSSSAAMTEMSGISVGGSPPGRRASAQRSRPATVLYMPYSFDSGLPCCYKEKWAAREMLHLLERRQVPSPPQFPNGDDGDVSGGAAYS